MINPEMYESYDVMTDRDASIFLPKAYEIMDWPHGAKVLDYGCGPGRRALTYIIPQIEKFDGLLHSVDISQEMVEYAKKTYPHQRVHYANGDIMGKFPYENVKFDNILSFYVLHFIEDIRTAFKGFHEVMSDGGHFGFMTLTAKSISTRALRRIAEMDQWREYMKGYEQFMVTWSEYPDGCNDDKKDAHFRSLLTDCGFHVKHMEILERKYDYADINDFLEICLVVNPFLHRVPESMYPALREDYRKVVTEIEGVPSDTKQITITHEHIFAVVQKPAVGRRQQHA